MTIVELPGTTSDKPAMTNTSPVIPAKAGIQESVTTRGEFMLIAAGSRIKSGMTVVELPGTTSDKCVVIKYTTYAEKSTCVAEAGRNTVD